MMILSTGRPINNPSQRRRGFTLIELVIVMALLVIVISLVTPMLTGFLGGRTLDAEVRRFVSLTHYGQSVAVSSGVPMVLWINPQAGAYGLQEEVSYSKNDSKAVDYHVGDGLAINVAAGPKSLTKVSVSGQRLGIHFSPDGNIVTATSVSGVSIREGARNPVWIKPSANGLRYEVQN